MNVNSAKNTSHDLLSHEETMELIKRAQNGDEDAQSIIVEHNIGLVRSVLKKFSNRGYDSEDLFQLGCIGLIKAIQKFDTSYKVRFSTYAVPMIIGEIKRFLRDDGIIKVSRSLKQTANKAKMTKESLTKKLGREPTIEEIAEEINIDKEDIIMALDSNHHPEYLYDVIHQNDGSPIFLIDKVSEEEQNIGILDKITLKETINKLEPRDRQIIILRYFKDKTQTEVAKMLGISQVQVSRIEKKVLNNMKKMLSKA
ncbi:RNA polymerase sporulation sigma factor SigF [Caldisalinibacter kiritimatiensis]|uniref:RNA polymerase sigma factor n=1 Tax=Caldisalinibacter kiritimatiensis TaxID=1304284 RepID=R1CY61_9FIRM|nr:RNA polymerase sporulation sigma factor SigF [Caldisalinibacter kiritimatiensis]EOD01509.1 RNA polymerase sporulation specific sigma factor SigF [Caldisalinibacter kiritimatiensis]